MRNIYLLFSLAIFYFSSFSAYGQDSLVIETELNQECRGQHNIAAITKGGVAGTRQFGSNSNLISDNPFYHFAIYNGLVIKTTLNSKYSIETGLFMEERSYSHGSNTLSNLILFPKIKLGLMDTFRLGNKPFTTSIKAGDFWDEDFQDIIRFYHIDFQALEVNFGYKNWNFKTNVIGDLSRNIGLDLHELYKFQIQHHLKKVTHSVAFSINELYAQPFGYHPTNRDANVAFYSKLLANRQQSVEGQIEVRINKEDRFSKALAIKYANSSYKYLSFYAAIRYYEYEFNRGYASFKPRYRNGDKFVGEQLYPLKNYYRPMNQWAFLSARQYRDVVNFEGNLKLNLPLRKKLFLFADIDFNYIYEPQTKRSFYYPLYNSGLQIKFTQNFALSLSFTNKQMNLDNFYQTFYISQLPIFSYNFSYSLENLKLAKRKIAI